MQNSPEGAANQLNADLGKWCSKWRQTCSLSKSEVILFSHKGHHNKAVILLNTQLKQVTSKKI